MQLLDAAVALLNEGRSVFPVRIEPKRRGYAKIPLCDRPMERRLTEAELRAVWREDANGIGVECGKISGLMRLDAEGPVPWGEFGEKPASGRFRTVSGGDGWLLNYMDGAITLRLWKGKGEHEELRVQSDGQYTVVPPSEGYEWLGDPKPAKVPRWLYDTYMARALDELTRECRPTIRQPEKADVLEALQYLPADDYDDWIKVGMALKTAEMFDEWEEWSKKSAAYEEGACEKKWGTFTKAGRTVSLRSIPYWAEKHGYEMPNKHESITELGFSKILANVAKGKALHSSKWGWLAWDGKRWDREDAEKAIARFQKDILKERIAMAVKSLADHLMSSQESDNWGSKRKSKTKAILAIRRHEDIRHVLGARKFAESETDLSVDYRAFDTHPFLLNCVNGTVDLRNGDLGLHDSSDKLTQLCPTPYDPAAEAPRWLSFIDEVFCGDRDLADWVQRMLGYCITGSTEHHILPIWYGTGRNGKSTLVKAVICVLGQDYARTLPSGFLAQHKSEEHPAKTVQLYAKRFVADLETNDGMLLNEEYVKRLTGGDELNARGMRENFWTFTPTHKLVLATNYEPAVRNQDPAIWGRIRKVPFNACFLGREEKGLDDRLAAEAPGILRWLVDGCLNWQEKGLEEPKSISDATESYKAEQNTVKSFHDQMLKSGNAEQKTRKSVIVAGYKAWCAANSLVPVSPKSFGIAIAKLGVTCDDNYYYVTLNK